MKNSTSQDNSIRVFVSYAREDLEIAQQLSCDLKSNGVNIWFDKDQILVGQNWKYEIRKAIQECDYFIALLSSNSISKRGFVQKELKIAFDVFDEFPRGHTYIIPIRLDACEPFDERLNELHRIDIFPSYKDCIDRLLRFLKPATHELNLHEDRMKIIKYPYGEFDILFIETSDEWVKLYLSVLGGFYRCDYANTYHQAVSRLNIFKYKVICGELFFGWHPDRQYLLSYIAENFPEISIILTTVFVSKPKLFQDMIEMRNSIVKNVLDKSSGSLLKDLFSSISKIMAE